jgi:hypothetical protein
MAVSNIAAAVPADPEVRRRMIGESDNEQLEAIRQHSLAKMNALLHGCGPAHNHYAIWSAFVEEIEAEQRKRADL